MKVQREATRLIESLGLRVVSLRQNGSNHYKATIQTPGGNSFTVVFANSPSDWRGLRNQRAWLKRKMKELDHGI